MKKPETFEFIDQDGSYVLVRPLDPTRGRVVFSNLLEQGELVYKNHRRTWKEAAALDRTGYSRMGPSELLPCPSGEADLGTPDHLGSEESRILCELLGSEGELESFEGDEESSEVSLEPEIHRDEPDSLMHLVVHYLKATEPGHDDGRWGRICDCPGRSFRTPSESKELRSFLSFFLRTRGLPPLERIVSKLRMLSFRKLSTA